MAENLDDDRSPSVQDFDQLMSKIQTVLHTERTYTPPCQAKEHEITSGDSHTELEASEYLVHAIHAGDVAMVTMLLVNTNSDPPFRDQDGNSLTRLAIKMDQLEIVRSLIEWGIDVIDDNKYVNKDREQEDLKKHLEGREDCHYMSLLMEATLRDNADILLALIEAGCDVNSFDYITNKTALHLAASHGSLKCAERLIAAGAHLDARDSRKNTPLGMAVFENHPEVAHLLLYSGSDVNMVCSLNRSPLIWAIALNCEIIDLLLYYGADTNKADAYDLTTPLHFSVLQHDVNSTEKIINCSANINALDLQGNTPLSIATQQSSADIMQVLLENGADPSVKDHNGMTPLLVAFYEERYDLARLLLKHNANVDITLTGTNMTLYQVCVQTDRQEAVELIHQVGVPNPFKQLRRLCDTHELKPRHLYSLTNDLRFVDWLRDEIFNPLSLKMICVTAVRNSLGHGANFIQKVQELPTAPKLKDLIIPELRT